MKSYTELVRQQDAYLAIRPAMTNKCVSRTRPVTRGGSGGSYEPPHEITRSGFLICIKLLLQIIT